MKNFTKALSLTLALAFSGAAIAQETPATLDGVKLVSAEQARDLASKGAPLVDTRAAMEFAEKSAKGAVSVPYKEKSAKAVNFDRAQDGFDLAKLPADKSKPVIFFCNSGTEANENAMRMARMATERQPAALAAPMSAPETRTTPMPPRPGAVAVATMVSECAMALIMPPRRCDDRSPFRGKHDASRSCRAARARARLPAVRPGRD